MSTSYTRIDEEEPPSEAASPLPSTLPTSKQRHKADLILVVQGDDRGDDDAALMRARERTRCVQMLAKRLEVRQEVHEFHDCFNRSCTLLLLEAIPVANDVREVCSLV